MVELLPQEARPTQWPFDYNRKSYTLVDPSETTSSNIQVLLKGHGSFYVTNAVIPYKDGTPMVASKINSQGDLQFSMSPDARAQFAIALLAARWPMAESFEV